MIASPSAISQASIQLATVRNPHDENPDLVVLDDVDDSVVTNRSRTVPAGWPDGERTPATTWGT